MLTSRLWWFLAVMTVATSSWLFERGLPVLLLVTLLTASLAAHVFSAVLRRGPLIGLIGPALLSASAVLAQIQSGNLANRAMIVYVTFFGLLMVALSSTRSERLPLNWAVAFFLAVTALGVLIEFVVGHPLITFTAHLYSNYTADGGYLRKSGFMSGPNEAGLVLCFLALAVAGRWFYERSAGAMGAFVVAAIALVSTGSRTSMLCLLVGVLALALAPHRSGAPFKRGTRLFLSAILIGAVFYTAAAVFPSRKLSPFAAADPSAIYRQQQQEILWRNTDWSHVIGAGFVNGNQLRPDGVLGYITNVDQNWLYTYYGLGLLGIFGLIVTLVLSLSRSLVVELPLRWPTLAVFFLACFTENVLASLPVLLTFALCATWAPSGAKVKRVGAERKSGTMTRGKSRIVSSA